MAFISSWLFRPLARGVHWALRDKFRIALSRQDDLASVREGESGTGICHSLAVGVDAVLLLFSGRGEGFVLCGFLVGRLKDICVRSAIARSNGHVIKFMR